MSNRRTQRPAPAAEAEVKVVAVEGGELPEPKEPKDPEFEAKDDAEVTKADKEPEAPAAEGGELPEPMIVADEEPKDPEFEAKDDADVTPSDEEQQPPTEEPQAEEEPVKVVIVNHMFDISASDLVERVKVLLQDYQKRGGPGVVVDVQEAKSLWLTLRSAVLLVVNENNPNDFTDGMQALGDYFTASGLSQAAFFRGVSSNPTYPVDWENTISVLTTVFMKSRSESQQQLSNRSYDSFYKVFPEQSAQRLVAWVQRRIG